LAYCGRWQEGDRAARQALRLSQRDPFAAIYHGAAAAMADQRDLATKSLDALRRVQPDVSLSWLSHEMPFKANTERERYLEAFRRAGLQ
jgi:hypothetical protein